MVEMVNALAREANLKIEAYSAESFGLDPDVFVSKFLLKFKIKNLRTTSQLQVFWN